MQTRITLALLLTCSAVDAAEWVSVQKPPESAFAGAELLVDAASIEGGPKIRHARIKVDFLSQRRVPEGAPQLPPPEALSYGIFVVSYNCDKKLKREDSMEMHHLNGAFTFVDQSKSPRWSSAVLGTRVEPDFTFVCTWKPK